MAFRKAAELRKEMEDAKKYVIALDVDLKIKMKEAWQNHMNLVELSENKTRDFVADMQRKTTEHIKKMEALISNKESLITSMELMGQSSRENPETLIENLEKSIQDISNDFYLFNICYQDWYKKVHQNMEQLSLGRYQLVKANGTFPQRTSSLTESLTDIVRHDPCQFPPRDSRVSCRFAPPIPKLSDTNRQINQNDYAIMTGLLVNSKNQIFLCDYDTSELRAYDENDKYMFTYKPEGILKPKDIFLISPNVFCVIYEGWNLFMFGVEDERLKLLRQFKMKVDYVSLCSTSGYFLACDKNCRIDLLNTEGKFVKTIVKLPKKMHPKWIEFHKIRNAPFQDSFLVYDRSDKKLFCVDMNGKILFHVGNYADEVTIDDFCCDQMGNIYLCTSRGIDLLTHGDWERKTLFTFDHPMFGGVVQTFIKDNFLYLTVPLGKRNQIKILSLNF